MKELLIRLVVGIAATVVVVIALSWAVAGALTDPANRAIGRPPLDLQASNITFASGSGVLIHGWLVRGTPGQGVVLLLHAIRGDRRQMLKRAEFLRARGFSVLMIDFQAHGETRGAHVTFGDRESYDVVGAIHYLHHTLPGERIGVIGVSMGAAAFVLAENRPPVDAAVLESLYPTIAQAVATRLSLGPFSRLFAPLVVLQLPSRFGIDVGRVRPIERMPQVAAPLLLIGGALDPNIPPKDAEALLAAATPPKELWLVKNAGQTDLYPFARSDYERRVGDFLSDHLRAAGAGGQ